LPDFGTSEKKILSEETAQQLSAMMRNDVIEEYGEDNFAGLELCAKSGTAEVGGDKEPHSWFVGFMDREDCPLAFVVVIENGGNRIALEYYLLEERRILSVYWENL